MNDSRQLAVTPDALPQQRRRLPLVEPASSRLVADGRQPGRYLTELLSAMRASEVAYAEARRLVYDVRPPGRPDDVVLTDLQRSVLQRLHDAEVALVRARRRTD